MWAALDNVPRLNEKDGLLYIALYNDQGLESRIWKAVKRVYNILPGFLKPVMSPATFIRMWTLTILRYSLAATLLKTLNNYNKTEGCRSGGMWWIGPAGIPSKWRHPRQ